MAILPTYDSKANLDPGSVPGFNFDNSQFSASATQGAAVQKLGNQGIELAQRLEQIQTQKAQFNTKIALDGFMADIDRQDQEALQAAPVDGSGLAQSRTDNFVTQSEKFLQQRVPANLRDEYAQRLALMQQQRTSQYALAETKLLGSYAASQINQDLQGSKVALHNDPNQVEARIADMAERIRIAPGIPESQKPEMIRAAQQDLMFVAAGRMAPTDPGAMARLVGVQYQGKASGASDKEAAAMSFFMSKGWTKEQAAGIVGNLMTESRLNTGARAAGDGADGSDSIGIAQWNAGRAAALKEYAASQGKPVTDLATQLAFVDQELRTTHSGAGDKLRNARTAAEAAAAVVTDYERPAGSNRGAEAAMHWADRRGHAERLAGGGVQVASAAVASDASPETSRADPRFDGLTYENKMKLVRQAEIGQSQEFKLQEQLASQAAAEAEGKRTAWVDQQQFAASKGQLVREQVEDDFKAGRYKSFEEYNGVIAQLNKADQDDANVRAGVQKLQTPGAVWTAGDKDILSAMDRKAGVPEAILKGDANTVTHMALRFRSTGMVSPEVKQTFEGIPRSGSPAQVQFAMSALDQMYRSNPNAFEEAFGTTTRQNLTTWQSMIDKDPKAFQEELKRAGDPATLKARESIEKEGRKIADAIDDKKLLNSFVDHWYSFEPGRPMTPPEVPGMAVLKVEYANTFAEEYRLAQGDETKATANTMRRLRETWAVSPSSGGKIMKYAPELLLDKGFPSVGGKGDWLVDQVDDAVRKAGGEVPTWLGKKVGVAPGATRPTYSLFATEETRAEIDALKAGRPLPDGRKSPTWTLVWEDPKTALKMMKPFSFDVDSAIAARNKRASELQADHERSIASAGSEMEKTRQTFEELQRRAQGSPGGFAYAQ